MAGCGSESSRSGADPTTATNSSGGEAGSGALGGSGAAGGAAEGGAGGAEGGSGGAQPSCPTDTLVPGEHQLTIEHDDLERYYEVQVPLSYENAAPVPLVFDIHGYSSNNEQQQQLSGFAELAEEEGFVVVRPQGFGIYPSWNGGDYCCGEAHSLGLDDVGLIRAILADVSAQLCIDRARVYATGLSNGGALSHRLGCEAGDLFAAIAPVSYPLDFVPLSDCQPVRPMPVMHQHGLYDTVAPYLGNLYQVSAQDSFAYWAEADGCTGDPVVTYSNNGSECETYETCDGGVQNTLCTIDGEHVLYYNYDSVPVAELAWQFMSQFTLP
jgi:polyhydroxybutyrate depolymerase